MPDPHLRKDKSVLHGHEQCYASDDDNVDDFVVRLPCIEIHAALIQFVNASQARIDVGGFTGFYIPQSMEVR